MGDGEPFEDPIVGLPGDAVAGVADAEQAALGVGDVDQQHQPHVHGLLRFEVVVRADDVGDGVGEIPLAAKKPPTISWLIGSLSFSAW